jgi:transglutaminase-like putative cysteine protease
MRKFAYTLALALISLCSLAQFLPASRSYGVEFVYNNEFKSHLGSNMSPKALQVFKNADKNGDGKISVSELQAFQNWLSNNYKYIENTPSDHPDLFFANGGGNCVGFATMTTCMLNYHGVVAYVASFGRVTPNKHALTIVKVTNSNVPGYLYYTLKGWGIPPGEYIPVDYTTVGGLSAIDRRWKIYSIKKPIRTPRPLYIDPAYEHDEPTF